MSGVVDNGRGVAWVACGVEGCEEDYTFNHAGVSAREVAQGRGWASRNGEDICPGHSS